MYIFIDNNRCQILNEIYMFGKKEKRLVFLQRKIATRDQNYLDALNHLTSSQESVARNLHLHLRKGEERERER